MSSARPPSRWWSRGFRPPPPRPTSGCRSCPARTVRWRRPSLTSCSPRASGARNSSAISRKGKNLFVAGQEVDPETFEEKHTYGIVTFWNLELKDKTPEWAAKVTGLPVEQITRVATDYGKAGPQSMSWVGGGPVMQVRGAYASMICHCLNGITGACDNVGGTLASNKEYTEIFRRAGGRVLRRDRQQGQEVREDRSPRTQGMALHHRGQTRQLRGHQQCRRRHPESGPLRHQGGHRLHEQLQLFLHPAGALEPGAGQDPLPGAHHHQRLGVFLVCRHPAAGHPPPVRKMGLGEDHRQRLPPCHLDAAGDQAHVGGQDRRDRNPLADRREAGAKGVRQHAALLQDDQGPGNRQGAAPTKRSSRSIA